MATIETFSVRNWVHTFCVTFLAWSALSCVVMVTCTLPMTSHADSMACDAVTKLYAEDLDMKLFQDSSSHPSYYRYLTVDLESNFLFVGAMNRIYGLYLKNIENKSRRLKQDFKPLGLNVYQCKINGKLENPDCQNHIRVLVRNTTVPNTFYMCATGAYSPVAYHLKLENDRFVVLKDASGLGVCPYDPNDNTTVVLVEKGTPGNVPSLFAGSVTDFIKSDPVITRAFVYLPNGTMVADFVRTIRNKNDWLNEAQFVGSFDVGEYVYFFFREVALEYTNCGKKIYSRVARLCKNDPGGSATLSNIWLSFQKARLNCSIPGEYPYYFDEIQDVYKVGDTFYGLFTTNINGLTASAVCGFNMRDINRAFDGPFKEQKDKQSIWLPIPENEVPEPRPGDCKQVSSLKEQSDLTQGFTNFVSRVSSMLMDKAVSHTFGKPIFYKSNCLMQKLVVVQNVAGHGELVFFTASNNGIIYKISAWPGLTPLDAPKTYVVTNYIPFSDSRPIWNLILYDSWIYFGTDMAVGQIAVETCDKYKKIDLCIYDPYCGWSVATGECRSNENNNLINYAKIDLLSYSLEEAIKKHVGELYAFEKISKTSGSSVTLRVEYRLHITSNVKWTRNGTGVSDERHILARDNSLIITDLRQADEGQYTATDNLGRTVAEYSLVVETSKEQIEQRWMRKFDQWCDEFERYQEDIRQWERKCSTCCQESALTNMVPALGGGN